MALNPVYDRVFFVLILKDTLSFFPITYYTYTMKS